SRGTSCTPRITQRSLLGTLANHRFHTSSNAPRPKKLSRLAARLIFRRGCSHSRGGSGFAVLATGALQFCCDSRQALAECAAQGYFMFVEGAFAVGTGV